MHVKTSLMLPSVSEPARAWQGPDAKTGPAPRGHSTWHAHSTAGPTSAGPTVVSRSDNSHLMQDDDDMFL